LSSDKLKAIVGHGLTAIVEVTLTQQNAEALQAFELRMAPESAVQQCYRVSPGPDFVLIVHVRDMGDYLALVQRVFTQDAQVRNVKAFFSIVRTKFAPQIAF
jgi:Lrp/AsnC family transcriptional regulator, leucine-responsive regulatory protein